MPKFTVEVQYSYRTYEEMTVIVDADSYDDIGEDEIGKAMAKAGTTFSSDEELQISDWAEEED